MYVGLALVLITVGCAYAALWMRGRRARLMLQSLPSYYNLPFIGAFYKFFGGGRVVLERLKELSEISDEKDLPFLVWAGPLPVLMISNGEDIKGVTNAFIEKPYYYNFGRVWVGNGLLTAPGLIWKRSVKNLANTFNSAVVEGYQEVYNAQAQLLVNKLKGEVGSESFDVLKKYLAHTTLETICQTALGVPHVHESIVSMEYHNAFNRAMQLLMQRGFNILLHLDSLYRLTAAHRELHDNLKIIHNVSETIINRRINEWENRKKIAGGFNQTKISGIRFKSFLDILLELRESNNFLTPEQIKSEVDTIIVGGQETIAITLFFTLVMLGSKPDIQDKLYAEFNEIFGDSKRPVKKEDLDRMQYCEAVIYETLRLYPPAPTIMRYADKDLKLRSFTIPKNTACGINAWGAGRSRRTWGPDAGKYRPERWLESDCARNNSSSFLAFSYGRRSCIGKKYAMSLMKTTLAYCIRELRFYSDADKLRLSLDLVLRPISGHLINVQLR